MPSTPLVRRLFSAALLALVVALAPTVTATDACAQQRPQAQAAQARDPDLVEITFWNSVKDSTDPEDMRAYLKQFPKGHFVSLAQRRLARLEGRPATPEPADPVPPAASERVVAPPPPPADTKPEGTPLDRVRGFEFEGNRYAAPEAATYESCAQACGFDDRCRAVEFYTDKKQCGLFDVVPPRRKKAGVDIGVKQGLAELPPPQVMRKLTRHYVEGEGYDTTDGSSFDECSKRCLNDGRCRMMEFYKPKKKCNLFDHTRAVKTADNDAEVAVKKEAE